MVAPSPVAHHLLCRGPTMRIVPALALAAALAGGCTQQFAAVQGAALDAPVVGVVDALTKIRPSFAVPATTTAAIEAARNEFEPFQIAIRGGAAGVKGLTA